MQVLALLGVVWRLAFLPMLLRVHEGREKPIGIVLATVMGASQFRTIWAMRMIGGRDKGKRLSALRGMGNLSDRLAVSDLVRQLDDADPEIRREATLALGRVGGGEAIAALSKLLNTPESDVQLEAALALGMTGDAQAVGPLVEKLADSNEVVREHVARALGELNFPEAAGALMNLLENDPSPQVFGRASMALAKLGVRDAVWEIVPRMHQTRNVALRRQLATAVGDLLGEPGRFYHLMNEELQSPGGEVFELVHQVRSRLRKRSQEMLSGPRAAHAQQLLVAAQHVELAMEEYELQKYERSVRQLSVAALELLEAVHGFTGQDDVAVEFALSRDRRFGVGLWLLQSAPQLARTGESPDTLLHLDALLGFHFVHHIVHQSEPT
jgi:HEAT repeat protein